jgi:sn-glycerol 3-phosphate transport system substrate-binding protein
MRTWGRAPGLVVGLVLACACSDGPAGDDGAATPGREACDEPAAVAADDPIVLWHAVHPLYDGVLGDALVQASAAAGVPVEAVRIEGDSAAVGERWREAGPDEAPDLALLSEDWAQVAADAGLGVPVGDCVRDAGLELLPAVEATYEVDGELRAVPFLASAPVLVYDRRDLSAAGLDPDVPPRTLDELRTTCEQVVEARAASTCLALDTGAGSGGSWFVDQWQAQLGEPVVAPGNGRDGEPADSVRWDAPGIADRYEFLQGLVEDGLAVQVGENRTNQDDLALLVDPDESVAMTLHTSASLALLLETSASGQWSGVDLAVAPFPGPGEGALVGGSALWVAADAADTDGRAQAAARVAVELAGPGPQATIAAETGYAPVTAAALNEPVLQQAWRELPGLRVAYDQLAAVDPSPATLGALVGPEPELRGALAAATTAILDGADPASALADAAEEADALLADYADSTRG